MELVRNIGLEKILGKTKYIKTDHDWEMEFSLEQSFLWNIESFLIYKFYINKPKLSLLPCIEHWLDSARTSSLRFLVVAPLLVELSTKWAITRSHHEDIPAEDAACRWDIYRRRHFKVKLTDIIQYKVINLKYTSQV